MPYSHSHAHYHLPRMKEMGRVYWCHSIGVMAISLAMIFVPIFLLKIGFSFTDVLIYILLQQVFALIWQYPVGRCFRFINSHYLLVLGSLCYVVFFSLLSTIELYHWPLWLLAVVWAFNRALYWTAFHYIFGAARRHVHGGRQIAGINALTMFVTTIAPAVGGVVATLFGITYIYVAAIILLLLSMVPILRSKQVIPKVKLNLPVKEVWAMRRDMMANVCNGMIGMGEFNIWPLLVFVLVGSYAGVGLLSSVIAIASIIVTIYVGRREETKGERRYIKEGLAAYSLTNIGRMIVQNSTQVFGLNLLGGIGRSLYITPFLNRYYTNSDGEFRLGYITLMEGAYSFGAMVYLIGLLILNMFLPMDAVLAIGLGIIAVGVIGVRLIR